MYNQSKDAVEKKIKAAEKYCNNKKLIFYYWQFNDPNMTGKKIRNDIRVVEFFESLDKV